MNNTDLPLLPIGVTGPDICDIVSLYLAVSHDLTPDQKRRVSAHLQICPRCVHEYQMMKRAAQLVSSLESTEPSARVDQAVMAAIAARSRSTRFVDTPAPMRSLAYNGNSRRNKKRVSASLGGLVAAAAVLVVALLSVMHFVVMPDNSAHAFTVPANVSWDGYVIYHTQTITSKGNQYHVASYHDMKHDMMNVETTMSGKLDVMVVSDGHQTLGMDMMNHVASWNADAWMSDDSMFDLAQLRKDLKSGQATSLGEVRFNGQEVYRIRYNNGEILLLDMNYKPVNVLQANGSAAEKAVYDKLELLKPAQVPDDMWDMSVPKGFKIGKLPAQP